MQDCRYELLRIPLLRTRVNKGKRTSERPKEEEEEEVALHLQPFDMLPRHSL
jgi:hypothetical protein